METTEPALDHTKPALSSVASAAQSTSKAVIVINDTTHSIQDQYDNLKPLIGHVRWVMEVASAIGQVVLYTVLLALADEVQLHPYMNIAISVLSAIPKVRSIPWVRCVMNCCRP